jgi:predicted N-acetyltransferase YhbS
MTILQAQGAMLQEVLDQTYPLWGEGLSREAYGRWNRAQLETPWGRSHLSRVALGDGTHLLSSAKRYLLEARVTDRITPVVGIGAVFTPPGQRGRGHAAGLIEAMLEDAQARGCRLALLFSEIGSAYYERLGFQVLPRQVLTIDVVRRPGAPALLVRAGEVGDFAAMAGITARYAEHAGFALVRSPELIAFGVARKRLLAGLGPPGLRELEFFVAEEGRRAVAYVVIAQGPRGRVLEECGDLDPTGARIGAILQVLAARMPTEDSMSMRAWLPASLRPPQVRVLSEVPATEIMMVRRLGEDSAILEESADPTIYWPSDVF